MPEFRLTNNATEELCQRVWIEGQIGYECSDMTQGAGSAAGSGSSRECAIELMLER